MRLDDGSTVLTFDASSHERQVEDRSTLHAASDGSVIGVSNGGLAPRRRARLRLRLTTAELASYAAFYEANRTTPVEFTDTVGRVWDARWIGAFDAAEDAQQADGWHSLRLELLLEAVADDTGRTAYSNVDAGLVSIQKSGATLLYWPVGIEPAAEREDPGTAYEDVTPGFVAADASRYAARTDYQALRIVGAPDAFATELEDYLADTLEGAVHPFTLTGYADGTYRWLGGLSWRQGDDFAWTGTIRLRGEV